MLLNITPLGFSAIYMFIPPTGNFMSRVFTEKNVKSAHFFAL